MLSVPQKNQARRSPSPRGNNRSGSRPGSSYGRSGNKSVSPDLKNKQSMAQRAQVLLAGTKGGKRKSVVTSQLMAKLSGQLYENQQRKGKILATSSSQPVVPVNPTYSIKVKDYNYNHFKGITSEQVMSMGNLDRKSYLKQLLQYTVYDAHKDAVNHEIQKNAQAQKLVAASIASDKRAQVQVSRAKMTEAMMQDERRNAYKVNDAWDKAQAQHRKNISKAVEKFASDVEDIEKRHRFVYGKKNWDTEKIRNDLKLGWRNKAEREEADRKAESEYVKIGQSGRKSINVDKFTLGDKVMQQRVIQSTSTRDTAQQIYGQKASPNKWFNDAITQRLTLKQKLQKPVLRQIESQPALLREKSEKYRQTNKIPVPKSQPRRTIGGWNNSNKIISNAFLADLYTQKRDTRTSSPYKRPSIKNPEINFRKSLR